jgi:hypothetical protein
MIKELIMYTILCDNCTVDVMTNHEFSGLGDIDDVKDVCNDSGWHREGDKHYCNNCFSHDEDGNVIIHNGK